VASKISLEFTSVVLVRNAEVVGYISIVAAYM
jgi:hypothetical protein